MPKITNWNQLDDDTWKNDKTGDKIKVQEGMDGDMYWDVRSGEYAVVIDTSIETTPLKTENNQVRIFNNKDDARDVAREWMRRNPYGKPIATGDFVDEGEATAEYSSPFIVEVVWESGSGTDRQVEGWTYEGSTLRVDYTDGSTTKYPQGAVTRVWRVK